MTTIFVTHDQEEALSMADRIAVMRDGLVEQCATPDELYQRPTTPFVAEFVGTMNHLPGVLQHGRADVFGQSLEIDGVTPIDGSTVRALVRPESVHVAGLTDRSVNEHGSDHDQGGPGATSVVSATSFFGAVTRLHLTTSEGLVLHADVGSHDARRYPAGTTVRITMTDRPVLVQATR